ncbi:hypothetical protein Ais01nite_00910 [Asanoa ishikariensis]|uniref:Uncharacterized protein n=1 Tax=Asanoa ishikariensis TaxID=137265 RepID=A0A1H3TRJ2_9ACTN|nr:hypothetical protein [Asanoa ishikariensis]GIF62056.1 hypothetical protein Ais01nite_00910 [Asanoa ishikariensis]SDZ51949.1 hypothetical protein SAMN05421684_6131 [Asanoa ishikariensis]
MAWTRRRLQVVTAAVVVVGWTVAYLAIITFDPPAYDPAGETAAKVNREFAVLLAVPTAVYVAAALLLLHFWRSGVRLPALDPPGRMLAVVVATLPDHRRDWGAAMTAELAEVRGRPARWRFALSCAGAALRLPPLGGAPALVLAAALAVAAPITAARAAAPSLRVFAATLVALICAWAVLTVARARQVRFPVPVPAALVVAGVVAAITATVVLLVREPSVAAHLPPARAVLLAALLAACLWAAVAGARSDRLAPHLGAVTALGYVVATLFAARVATDPVIGQKVQDPVTAVIAMSIFLGPAALFFLPAALAAAADGSFRSGLRAGLWTAITYLPLAYAVSVSESLRIYTNGGGVGFDHLAGPVGVILDDAVFWQLVYGPVVGVPCAVFGAAFGSLLHTAGLRTPM